MLLIAAVASLMRGERYVHTDAPELAGQGLGAGLAREAAALDGIPGQDVAYADAVEQSAGRPAR
jgi:hypothetical protein